MKTMKEIEAIQKKQDAQQHNRKNVIRALIEVGNRTLANKVAMGDALNKKEIAIAIEAANLLIPITGDKATSIARSLAIPQGTRTFNIFGQEFA